TSAAGIPGAAGIPRRVATKAKPMLMRKATTAVFHSPQDRYSQNVARRRHTSGSFRHSQRAVRKSSQPNLRQTATAPTAGSRVGFQVVVLALFLLGGTRGFGRRLALLADDGERDVLVGRQVAELGLVAGLLGIAFLLLQFGPGKPLDLALLVKRVGRAGPAND